ncbi:hypothetical protein ACQPZF_25975 [Actinosynnema sp. CS-041913]|uniref:hypothetical protein n=1 Tax=Actinosynnema sp. CS-041913 TaxID=3239917 RepID=UPI003D931CC0
MFRGNWSGDCRNPSGGGVGVSGFSGGGDCDGFGGGEDCIGFGGGADCDDPIGFGDAGGFGGGVACSDCSGGDCDGPIGFGDAGDFGGGGVCGDFGGGGVCGDFGGGGDCGDFGFGGGGGGFGRGGGVGVLRPGGGAGLSTRSVMSGGRTASTEVLYWSVRCRATIRMSSVIIFTISGFAETWTRPFDMTGAPASFASFAYQTLMSLSRPCAQRSCWPLFHRLLGTGLEPWPAIWSALARISRESFCIRFRNEVAASPFHAPCSPASAFAWLATLSAMRYMEFWA